MALSWQAAPSDRSVVTNIGSSSNERLPALMKRTAPSRVRASHLTRCKTQSRECISQERF